MLKLIKQDGTLIEKEIKRQHQGQSILWVHTEYREMLNKIAKVRGRTRIEELDDLINREFKKLT